MDRRIAIEKVVVAFTTSVSIFATKEVNKNKGKLLMMLQKKREKKHITRQHTETRHATERRQKSQFRIAVPKARFTFTMRCAMRAFAECSIIVTLSILYAFYQFIFAHFTCEWMIQAIVWLTTRPYLLVHFRKVRTFAWWYILHQE